MADDDRAARPVGRPSSYTEETANRICERIMGGESLLKICRDDNMPSRGAVYLWLAENAAFMNKYAHARDVQADHFADEMIEIADDGTGDLITKTNKDGTEYETVDQEHINRSRLRVDTRKWLAARMAPKKYGDRVMNEHTGKDGGPIKSISVGVVDPIEASKIYQEIMGE